MLAVKMNATKDLDAATAARTIYAKNTGAVYAMYSCESQLAVLHRMSSLVSSDMALDDILGGIVGLTVEVTNCDACLVYLVKQDTNEMVLRACHSPHATDLGRLRMRMGEGVAGWAPEHKSVVALSSHPATDRRFRRFQTFVQDAYQAFLSVPLVGGGEVTGIVNLYHREPHEHSREEMAVSIFAGQQLGVAVSKCLLKEERIRLLNELETRKLVERAKGILQRRHNLTEEESYVRLRNHSRRLRRPMRELAAAIIETENLSRQTATGA